MWELETGCHCLPETAMQEPRLLQSHSVPSSATHYGRDMRPSTTLAVVLLIVVIFGAGIVNLLMLK
jgi:hypothetical protein